MLKLDKSLYKHNKRGMKEFDNLYRKVQEIQNSVSNLDATLASGTTTTPSNPIQPGASRQRQTELAALATTENKSLAVLSFNIKESTMATGRKGTIFCPWDCEILDAYMFMSTVGIVDIDIWRCQYASWPTTSIDSICGKSLFSCDGTRAMQNSLEGWTTRLNRNDILTIDVTTADVTVDIIDIHIIVQKI